jgi:hypothetical protein
MGGPVRSALGNHLSVDGRPGTLGSRGGMLTAAMGAAAGSHFECGWADCLEAAVMALLLPAKNKRNQPSLP